MPGVVRRRDLKQGRTFHDALGNKQTDKYSAVASVGEDAGGASRQDQTAKEYGVGVGWMQRNGSSVCWCVKDLAGGTVGAVRSNRAG